MAGPIVAGLTYPMMRNAGPFITAGAIAVVMALWTLLLRQQPAPQPAAAEAIGEAKIVN